MGMIITRAVNVVGARDKVGIGSAEVWDSLLTMQGIWACIQGNVRNQKRCKEGAAYHRKRCYCVKRGVEVQLNAEKADGKIQLTILDQFFVDEPCIRVRRPGVTVDLDQESD
ncbi:hypothetical protein Tco_1569730 [Tanacetum coccineum]